MSGSASLNTPLCGEWTRTAGKDESMLITGADFTRFSGNDEGKDTRFTVYGTSGFQKDASIQRLERTLKYEKYEAVKVEEKEAVSQN